MPIDPNDPNDPNEPWDPDQGESDEEAEARASAEKRRAQSGVQPVDPAMQARGSGRKVGTNPDFSDPDDPTKTQADYYPGDVAPSLAGEREKITQSSERLKKFIDKYHKYAVEKFYGAKASTVRSTSPEDMARLYKQYGHPRSWPEDIRTGKRGGVHGIEQLMNKDEAVKLVTDLPEMPQDEAIDAQRKLYHYFHRIFVNVRKTLRDIVRKDMDYSSKPRDVAQTDADGNTYYTQEYDRDSTEYEAAMEDALEGLEKEKVRVIGDLGVLAKAGGTLKRAGGKYGDADATHFSKKARWMKPPEVIAKQPDVSLGQRTRALAGPAPAEKPRKGAPPPPVRARGPIIRKKNQEAFDRFMDQIFEIAVADHRPSWIDEL